MLSLRNARRPLDILTLDVRLRGTRHSDVFSAPIPLQRALRIVPSSCLASLTAIDARVMLVTSYRSDCLNLESRVAWTKSV